MGLEDVFGAAGIALKVVKGVQTVRRYIKAEDAKRLAGVRQNNNNCPHILELDDRDDVFAAGLRNKEIKQQLYGSIFGLNESWHSTYWHPDPWFKPANRVEWLVRSQWKGGGAYSAAGIGYKDYYWKSSCDDRTGGYDTAGYCPACLNEAREKLGNTETEVIELD